MLKGDIGKSIMEMVKSLTRDGLEKPDVINVRVIERISSKIDLRKELEKEVEEAIRELLE